MTDQTGHPAIPAVSPLVGRASELLRLASSLQVAVSGRGRALFLVSEAGVGKTRLARETLALARVRGFRALEGCAAPLERDMAYTPFLRAFTPFLRDLSGSHRAHLVRGLPHLGRLFGDLGMPDPVPLSDPALEKTRLFEAVARLLERLARETPLVLFLDDLHWADPASLALLHYLARGLADLPLLLLGAYRPDEVGTAPGLSDFLRSLQRLGLSDDLALDRLAPGAVATLVAGLLGDEPPVELLDLVTARSAGTPLLVEALIRTALEAGQLRRIHDAWVFVGGEIMFPAEAHALFLERLNRLAPPARHILDLVAVAGQAPDHALLAGVARLDEESLLAAIQHLLATGLLVEQSDGEHVTYVLSHPLIQEVATAALPKMARRRAHTAFAAALEKRRSADLDVLARHYQGAGPEADPDRALRVLLAAGEQARERSAHAAAARHFAAALGQSRLHRQELVSTLLERLGESWELLGEEGAAVGVWAEALTVHERAGHVTAVARLRCQLARAEWERGNAERAQRHLAAGLAALTGQSPSQELADLLHVHINTLKRRGDLTALPAAIADLSAVAQQLRSPRAWVELHLAEADLHDVRGELAAMYERALLALAAADGAHDPLLTSRVHDILTITSLALGDHQAARTYAEASLALARRLGAPTLEVRAEVHLATIDLMSGDWGDALRRSGRACALARRVSPSRGLAQALIVRTKILVWSGEFTMAAACIAEARAAYSAGQVADQHMALGINMAEALLALERGDATQALDLIAPFAASLQTSGGVLIGATLLAEAHLATGTLEEVLAIARRLAAVASDRETFLAAAAARLEGLASAAAGETAAARVCLARAASCFAALAMPFEAARARFELTGLAAPDPPSVITALRESLATFERLGARRYADRARRRLRALGIRPPAPRRSRTADGHLSPRELEVACLIAEGRTNAAIAQHLVISPRTVTTHLERIYARLGINSRSALARYVVESGLLTRARNYVVSEVPIT